MDTVRNVVFGFGTTRGDEPHFEDSYRAGYGIKGATFTGNIYDYDGLSPFERNAEALSNYALSKGSNLVVTNVGGWGFRKASGDYFYQRGLHLITPAGTNVYHSAPSSEYPTYELVTGAGRLLNMTGFLISVFDIDPYALSSHIVSLTQSTPSEITVVTDTNPNYFSAQVGMAVEFSGVTGYLSNIDGVRQMIQSPDNAGLLTTFKIAGTLGAGTYGGNGYVTLHFSSYANPYIAGQASYLANFRGCSLYEALYCIKATADPVVPTTQYNGYGKVNIDRALAYNLTSIPADPFNHLTGTLTLGVTCVGGECSLTLSGVENALTYYLYNKGELIETFNKAPAPDYQGFDPFETLLAERSLSSQPHSFQVKAVRGSEELWSNIVNVPYYYYPKLIVRESIS